MPNSRAMPKSESLTWFVASEEEIGRLDVAMDDTAVVGVTQRVAGLNGDEGDLAPIEAAAVVEFVLEAASVDQLHGVVELAFLLAEGQQTDDVGMAELAEGLDLDFETLAEIGFAGQARNEAFEGHGLVGLDVDGLVDRAHFRLDRAGAQSGTGRTAPESW